MVAHFTMRTHRVNQAFQFVEGIWLHRESHQIRFSFRKKIGYDGPFDVTKCLQQIEMHDLLHEMSNHLL